MRKNILRKTAALFTCVAAAASLTACRSGSTSADSAPTAAAETVADTAENTEEALTGANDGSQEGRVTQTKPLVVYLNDFDAVIPEMFKEATGYDVEVVSGNGAETMSRIAAEAGNPQWDVVWIDSMYDVYNLAGEGQLLTDWEPENAANLTEFSRNLVPDNKLRRGMVH